MKRLKFFLTVIFLIILGISNIFGQTYPVKGTILESDSNKPLGFVQVALFSSQDQARPVSFSDSDDNGLFSLEVPKGKYTFKAFFLGYKDFVLEEIEINGPIDLGEIKLAGDSQNLEEVVVQTSKLPFRSSMEGITITPENNLANVGGTLLDILRNTPSIIVSEDGSISLRGSTGTNILINGRNSSLTQNLDQLPASAVEEIRIINNPNARYDAEAEGGVIDIILKKGQDLGTHGGLEATYGTRNRTNLGARMNHRSARLNTFVGYNFRDWKDVGNRRSTRNLFEEEETLKQNTESTNRNVGHNLTYGADYYFGNNMLSYEGVYQSSLDRQINTLFAELERGGTEPEAFDYVRRNNESETDTGLDNALIFEHNFKDKGHLFRATASHSFRNQFKTQEIDIFNNTLNPIPENLTGQELAYIDEIRNISVLQADYIKPLQYGKFETGVKSILRKFDNDYQYFRFNEAENEFVEDELISNRFIYEDQIYAGYALISVAKSKFEYSLGLRGEMTVVDTYLQNTGDRNQQNYFNLFPSVQGLYNVNEKHSLKFSYSRRIDRPTAWRLNPFPDITDSLNVRRGNPNLQPEMINSFELGHMANFEKASLTSNLFYRKVNGQLDFITIVEDGISYSQPENLLSAESYGLELIGTGEVSKWYSINGGLTLFRISVDGSNIGEEFTNSGFAWNVKVTQDFKLPFGFNFQLAGNYESPEIEAQGRDLAQYFIDGTLQKSLFNNKGSLALSVRDIFDTRRFAGFARTNSFSQDFYSKQETRIVLLSARFNF
ncbi:Outer membrane receptor proteins, mostly Fe transport [Aquiflexum balticum DSM 16537]|uniref:Outer membrane receptor proteins, mostly Fe transport n=1 Tax=Aquiflexum balticum DSM 16537 TaxID=758820 RepID=A0A1W2H7L1_9BACT|nr:outer membrane beta-barrel family protein [Aquiflexum balticum]SMD44754.1 Outer membrane receptor proteins, mostly Fe transport [Aquiflexum balticum DSM 16537]